MIKAGSKTFNHDSRNQMPTMTGTGANVPMMFDVRLAKNFVWAE